MNTPNAPEEGRDVGALPQHPTALLPERPRPRAFADRSFSTRSLPYLSAASSRLLPSSTQTTTDSEKVSRLA